MSNNKDFRPILAELKAQGWEVEQTKQGHYRAVPPDPSKSLVHFAASLEPHALKNTVHDLRRSGFDWPPPRRSGSGGVATEPEWYETENEAVLVTPCEVESKEQAMERLWAELKEAKTYLELTDEHLRECEARLLAAQRAFENAKEERRKAAETLRTKKAEFDVAFGAAA